MTDNIESLAAHRAKVLDDNTLLTPLDCARALTKVLEDHEFPKMLVVLLNDRDDGYAVDVHAANMRCSEMLALLEVARISILAEMGY